jgi:hypothetical protein
VELKTELLRLLDDPVDTTRLLAQLEAYEAECRLSAADEIAECVGRLSRSSRPVDRQLADEIDRHYRNANFRVSITQPLLAKVLPRQDEPQLRSVSDTIMGVAVSGQAASRYEMRARLLPSRDDTLRIELQALGHVDSDTTGWAGSVTTFTQTQSRYRLSKVVEFHNDGIRSFPVQVRAVQADTQLNELRTNWDGIPLFGDLARSMAASQYEQTEPQRRAEVEQRVASRAVREFEAEAAEAVSRIHKDYVKHLIVPLHRLDLRPEVVTEPAQDGRMTARIRLATENQLGSHTPRPRAVANCLASAQLHESLINNGIEQLALGGRTLTGAKLIKYLNAKLNIRLRLEKVENEAANGPVSLTESELEQAERVQFTFAQQDAVRVRLADGQLLLIVSLDELEAGGRRWRNFQIIVPHELRPAGTTVELVQTAEVGIQGRISSRSQIILRGIMINFFEKDRTHRVMDAIMSDPRLAGTQVTQAVITDGWIGLSLGNRGEAPAEPTATRRRAEQR